MIEITADTTKDLDKPFNLLDTQNEVQEESKEDLSSYQEGFRDGYKDGYKVGVRDTQEDFMRRLKAFEESLNYIVSKPTEGGFNSGKVDTVRRDTEDLSDKT